jgi:hypothetical protein
MSMNTNTEAAPQDVELDVLPASPPPSVLAAVAAASERAEAMAAEGRELHFAIDADGGLEIEIRSLSGTVMDRVTPSEALRIMSGLDEG